MRPFFTFSSHRGKPPLAPLPHSHDFLHGIVVRFRRPLKPQLVPFFRLRAGFYRVPEQFPVVGGGVEGCEDGGSVGDGGWGVGERKGGGETGEWGGEG